MDGSPFFSLAPLQGLTTKEFRRAFFRRFGGFSRAYAPFVKAVSEKVSPRHYRDILSEAEAPYDLVPQVICGTSVSDSTLSALTPGTSLSVAPTSAACRRKVSKSGP